MRKGKKRGLSLLLVLVLLLGLVPGTAWAADNEVTVRVSAQAAGSFLCAPQGQVTVPADLAESYGYTDEVNGVSALDALVRIHEVIFGESFTPETAQSLLNVSGGYITCVFGEETSAFGFAVNGDAPVDKTVVFPGGDGYAESYMGLSITQAALQEGDLIEFFAYQDTDFYLDYYTWIATEQGRVDYVEAQTNEPLSLMVGGYCYAFYSTATDASYKNGAALVDSGDCADLPVVLVDANTGAVTETGVTVSEEGTFSISFQTAGTYFVSVQGDEYTPVIMPWCVVEVKDALTEEDKVSAALANLDETDLLGKNPSLTALSQNLTLPQSTYPGTQIVWTLDTQDSEVIGYYGDNTVYVGDAKAYPVSATLTATVSSIEDGQVSAAKSFLLAVPAAQSDEGDQATVVDYGSIMSGIAAGWSDNDTATSLITENDLPWAVLDMAAYGSGLDAAEQGRYDALLSTNASLAKYILAEYARKQPVVAPEVPGVLDIYSSPSILLSRIAGGAGERAANDTLITFMVSYLTGAARDVDTAAAMIAALAPYYQEADVKSAVDTGVIWLSGQQGENAAWKGNSNSTAMVIVALSALGIDAHTDSRFIKNSKSAVEGLLSFALADNSGFGYGGNVTYNGMATEQGFRALVAYARMKENQKAYNIYLEAKDSTGAVPAPDITATVDPGEGGSGSGGSGGTPEETVTVTISVMVPPSGGAEGQYTYYHDSALYSNLLGGSRGMTVTSGTTALSVLKSALDGAGISYVADSTGYVTMINGLSAFDHGPRSGWQYMVNGTAPLESAATYTFTKNSTLIWYFTDDYTREKDGESWGGEPTEKPEEGNTVQVVAGQDGSYQITLPKDTTGSVLVTIPDVSQGDLLVIVHADGTQEVVKKSVIQGGKAYLMLEENATVKVVEYASAFTDIREDAWYAGAVDFTAGRGLFSGVGDGSFAPNETLSRGMVVTVLYALEAPGAQKTEDLFADVPGDAWYAQGTAWAVETGIVSGYGDGQFGPNDAITREQLALMLYRYAQNVKLDTDTGTALDSFGDQQQVSSWARQAMSWAVGAGILGGTPEGNLNPGGTATRAEAAVMVNQFVAWMLKSV